MCLHRSGRAAPSVPGVSAGRRLTLTLTLTPTLMIGLRSRSVYDIAQRRHHAPEVLGTCMQWRELFGR
jgi:hypothetical protein